jgi:hypothetical protein
MRQNRPRHALRREIIRRGLYTPCCASCGELPVFPDSPQFARAPWTRPCVSLPVDFPVDAVILPAGRVEEERLRAICPWLRRIIRAGEGDAPGSARLLHTTPGLSDHYLAAASADLPAYALSPHDFFTPNGIPYLTPTRSLFAQTRENAAAFSAESDGDDADYFISAGRRAVAAGRAIALGAWE